MKIGIIGVGAIGSTLARKLAGGGHEVRVANSRGREAVKPFADEIGATPADASGAATGADMVIISIPFPVAAELPDDLLDSVEPGVPVVDTGNYYPGLRDPQIAEIEEGKPESVWVSEQLGRPVIKAFNNILAESLSGYGRPEGSEDRIAIAVAGNDAEQKQMVMDVVDEVGFDPVDGGTLAESWRQQPLTPAYCCDYGAEKMRKGLALAEKGEAKKKRGEMRERMEALGPAPNHDEVIAMNRSLSPLG